MKQSFFLIFLFFLFFSCKQENQIPQLKTQKVSSEKLTLIGSKFLVNNQLNNDSAENSHPASCVEQLNKSAEYYNQRNEKFSLQNFKDDWMHCKLEQKNANQDVLSQKKWIEATGLLLQLTTEAKYAEELENIYLHSNNREIQNLAASYVITKNVDHLHVNIFVPAKITYNHSLDGKVELVQETNYPSSGKVDLKFSMEERRYIELQIRIPSWAEEAQVTVKGVKYFAPAGGYCKIAKKWREGDLVEIIFPSIQNQSFI